MKNRKFIVLPVVAILSFIFIGVIYLLYRFNYIPHTKYTDVHFGITTYKSNHDQDKDGVDDQTDILNNANDYLATKPKYKSKYYTTGYPDDEYGVCTDVVAFSLKDTGYDLMELVSQDITENPQDYDIDKPDINIDFRRVRNLSVYFKKTAINLTTDTTEIAEWQAGDIVAWKGHIGIISNRRNKYGIPFVLHNANPYQAAYEEDILTHYGKIIGHYRIS